MRCRSPSAALLALIVSALPRVPLAAVSHRAPRASQLQAHATASSDDSEGRENSTDSATQVSWASAGSRGAGSIFHRLLKDWKEVPDLEAFTTRCVALVSKLLPELRREYTAMNVPKVLVHECDVYATKQDYVVANLTTLEDARDSCRYSARRLGGEFLGGKDYKGWCQDLHAYLEEQAKRRSKQSERENFAMESKSLQGQLDKLRSEYNDMLVKKHNIAGELDELSRHLGGLNGSMPCCPFACRQCSL